VKTRFESKWANRAAQAGVTLAAVGLFLLIRPDTYAYAKDHLRADYQREIITPKLIDAYVRANHDVKVQVGAGTGNLPGWLNTDIEPTENQAYLDATKPLPFIDGSVHYIFGEHVIEHVSYEDAVLFLKESHRVLAPGGKIRMVTPNLLQFVALLDPKTPEQKQVIDQYIPKKLDFHFWPNTPDPACYIINNEMRSWGHQFVYTPTMLRASFERAGFTQIRQYTAGETDDAVLKGVEMRPRTEFSGMNAYEAMAFEATK